ncbi:GNAT family N-acetyltransferase [Scytonema sp. UIC 10036]|uniref:GNAT family N-acetyltransferase n=1 Tax=Scytonema sp. UIC 10036 TaxID=2304196 RepID=UPI0012DABDF4|nr:GNAT family N-acetyltransferase [Scytonema sp. UIC 10036]MUH01584.1 GNAT family N-acetyltransferase [Scytonema sp. UIC 10036]
MNFLKVEKTEYSDYMHKFKETAYEIFPILSFQPHEIDAFINFHQKLPYNDNETIYLIEIENNKIAFCRSLINNYGKQSIQYIIPSLWSSRYQIIKAAIEQIKTEFIQVSPANELVMTINEKVPSHNAYYAGLLPELNFDMQPRLTMTASQNILETIELPQLSKNIHEISFVKNRLSEFIDLYNKAYAVHEGEFTSEKIEQLREFRRWQLTNAQDQEDAVKTWVGLEYDGRIIGSCYGRIWGNEMSIEELALLPEFYGNGLGRFLAIRCMYKLKSHFGEPSKYFFIGTNRTYQRALRLYYSLGFKIDLVQTYATFFKNGTSI